LNAYPLRSAEKGHSTIAQAPMQETSNYLSTKARGFLCSSTTARVFLLRKYHGRWLLFVQSGLKETIFSPWIMKILKNYLVLNWIFAGRWNEDWNI